MTDTPPKKDPLIECQALSVRLGQRTILSDITLSVGAGEIVSIIGPNGSGKTTLFRALIGAVTPSRGTLFKAPQLNMGYVPQKLHIDQTFPITVQRFMRLPGHHSQQSIDAALRQAGIPDLHRQQMTHLSGGQFQRVLLARALLGSPNLLLLDEAAQGLDHRALSSFYRQIDHVREQLGCAILMISHELHVVMRQTDHVICLNGHICCQGKPEIVKSSPEYHSLFDIDGDNESAIYLHRNHAA